MSYDLALLVIAGVCLTSFVIAVGLWIARRRRLDRRSRMEAASWALGVLTAVLTVLGFLAQLTPTATLQPADAGGAASGAPAGGTNPGAAEGKPWLAPVSPGLPQVVRVGIPATDWPNAFELVKSAGYKQVGQSAYDIAGMSYINAVFRPADGTSWWSSPWLTAAALDTAVAEKAAAGLYLTDLTGALLDGQVRYLALWDAAASPGRVYRYGLTSAEQQEQFDTLADDGYRLVTVSAVAPGGLKQWTALYEKDPRDEGWMAYWGTSPDRFDERMAEGREDDMYPIRLAAHRYEGNTFFCAVWRTSPATDDTRRDLTAGDLAALLAEKEAQGVTVQSIAGYATDAGARYLATW